MVPPPSQTPRLLIVEDDDGVRAALVRTLRISRVHHVVDVRSAEDALQHLMSAPFEAVVSDEDLGVGRLTGSALLEIVRRRWPWMRRVLMSGQPRETHEAFLRKPWSLHELRALVSDPWPAGEGSAPPSG